MSHIQNKVQNDNVWFSEPLKKSTLVDAHPRQHGFQNGYSDNVCYVNSTVQCLLHCQMFVTALQTIGVEHEHVTGTKCALFGLIDALYILLKGDFDAPRLTRIADWAPAIGEQFIYGRQCDANEFLAFLIDALQNVEKFGCEASNHLPGELAGTLVGKVVCGTERYSKYCTKCKTTTECAELEFTGATPIDIGGVDSIDQALQQKYGREEERESHCENCGEEGNQICHFRPSLVKAPNIFIFLLRSNLETTFNTSLQFTLELDQNIMPGKPSTDKVIYELRGVQYRYEANREFAHFTSIVKNGDTWWHMNDGSATEMESVPNGENVFMLYYERLCNNDPVV